MINWLIQNKEFLSISGIERHLKMPNSTLVKAVNGSQELPKKWIEPLNNFFNNFAKIEKSDGKKIKQKELLSTDLATKKGYCA
jgi:hypothetical protein